MDIKSKTTILSLNYDVLDIIFRNLCWETYKLSLAKAHPHFSAAFVHHSRHRYNAISTIDRDWTFVLEWFGHNVISLRDERYETNQMLELAAKYCPNLEVIEFRITMDNIKTVEENLLKLKKLNYIILNRESVTNTEKIFKILRQLQNLKRMALYNWNICHLAPMNNMNLDHLEFSELDEDDIKVVPNIWRNLKSLKTHAYPSALNLLSKYCEQLEYLRLWCYNDCEKSMFAYFPKLKRLKIFYCDEGNDNGAYFQTLHGKYNNQLETLEFPKGYIDTAKTAKRIAKLKAVKTLCCKWMDSRCIRYIAQMSLEKLTLHQIKESDLLILLCECKTLKWIHLDSLELENDSLDTLLDILKLNGFRAESPFVLRLYKFDIRDCLINKLALCSNAKLLDIQKTTYNLLCRY